MLCQEEGSADWPPNGRIRTWSITPYPVLKGVNSGLVAGLCDCQLRSQIPGSNVEQIRLNPAPFTAFGKALPAGFRLHCPGHVLQGLQLVRECLGGTPAYTVPKDTT